MPRFRPSLLISDAYGSVGDVTFYHRGGKCYYRKRSAGNYPGTSAQLSHLDVHRRALAAWRTLDQATQTLWHEYGKEAVPHKPPFDGKAHISGQNLFVSSYHGFATLGNEHIPVLQRFVKFPPFAVCLADAVKLGENLVIPAAVAIPSAWEAGRYRLLAKLLLDVPGKGKHPGHLKNYLADRVCGSGDVLIVVPNYTTVWGLDLEAYQIHAKFVLLDTVTGYRSQELEYSTCLRATVGNPTDEP